MFDPSSACTHGPSLDPNQNPSPYSIVKTTTLAIHAQRSPNHLSRYAERAEACVRGGRRLASLVLHVTDGRPDATPTCEDDSQAPSGGANSQGSPGGGIRSGTDEGGAWARVAAARAMSSVRRVGRSPPPHRHACRRPCQALPCRALPCQELRLLRPRVLRSQGAISGAPDLERDLERESSVSSTIETEVCTPLSGRASHLHFCAHSRPNPTPGAPRSGHAGGGACC